MKIADATIIYCGPFISENSIGVMGLLTSLLAVFYALNYPVQCVEATGSLGVFLLDHHKRATNILALLK